MAKNEDTKAGFQAQLQGQQGGFLNDLKTYGLVLCVFFWPQGLTLTCGAHGFCFF